MRKPRKGDLVTLSSSKYVDNVRGKVARITRAKTYETHIEGEIVTTGKRVILSPKRGLTITTLACI